MKHSLSQVNEVKMPFICLLTEVVKCEFYLLECLACTNDCLAVVEMITTATSNHHKYQYHRCSTICSRHGDHYNTSYRAHMNVTHSSTGIMFNNNGPTPESTTAQSVFQLYKSLKNYQSSQILALSKKDIMKPCDIQQ